MMGCLHIKWDNIKRSGILLDMNSVFVGGGEGIQRQ